MTEIKSRKGMPSIQLDKAEFTKRFREQFFDPAFEKNEKELAAIIETAWDGYDVYRKNPKTVRAGAEFKDPEAELPVEWLDTRRRIREAEARRRDPGSPSRILLINGSMRSDWTCPGEVSKSWRLMMMAKDVIDAEPGFETEILDLSRLVSEYGRNIHPCKSCVSTAQPLCHWPCSCYPNFAMGQVNDWMNEIYPMWAAAHGVMIVTPVNWYQAPAGLKAMIDRLVCANGGNADPTSTNGKDPDKAKEVELAGWDYPNHLAGRLYSVIVHGDAAGVENLRRILTDWLNDLGLLQAGHRAVVGTYIGYLGSYAANQEDFDKDLGIQEDTRTAARSLVRAIRMQRKGEFRQPDEGLHEARPK